MAKRLSETLRRWTRRVFGVLFLLAGIAGLFLPILQGVLFLLIGTLLLANESIWVRRRIASLNRRYPDAYAKFRKWRKKFQTKKRVH